MIKYIKFLSVAAGVLLASSTYAVEENAKTNTEDAYTFGCVDLCNKICYTTAQGTTVYGKWEEEVIKE